MPRQKYEQIYSILKGQIEAGDYPVGGLLPSENVLIGEFQCSRNTVRRALANLVRDGYVQTSQGRGVCNIYQPLEPSSYSMGTIESFAETSRRTGQHSTTRVVHFSLCAADPALARRTGFAAACFAAPMAVYYLWNVRYVGWLVARNSSSGGVGETSAALSDVVVNGVKILLGLPVEGFFAERRPQFLQAMADMGAQFWTDAGKLSMIGQGRNVVLLILAVFAVAFAVAAGWQLRGRIAALAALSTLCFAGYNLMLALSYGFIFTPDQTAILTDYNRYIYSYYIGWFLIALACLTAALLPQREFRFLKEKDGLTAICSQHTPRWGLAGQGAVLALAAAMLLRQGQLVLPQLSVLGFADSEFADRRGIRAEAELVCSYLTQEDRVFFVSQGDNGERWFSAVFDFYPILVDYSGVVAEMDGGGGELGLPELRPTEEGPKNTYYHGFTAEELDAIVRGNGCTVLYLQTIDDIFVQSYQELFTDGLAAALDGDTLLYRVTDEGFAPMEMEVSAS